MRASTSSLKPYSILQMKGSCKSVQVEIVQNSRWGGDLRWDVQG